MLPPSLSLPQKYPHHIILSLYIHNYHSPHFSFLISTSSTFSAFMTVYVVGCVPWCLIASFVAVYISMKSASVKKNHFWMECFFRILISIPAATCCNNCFNIIFIFFHYIFSSRIFRCGGYIGDRGICRYFGRIIFNLIKNKKVVWLEPRILSNEQKHKFTYSSQCISVSATQCSCWLFI